MIHALPPAFSDITELLAHHTRKEAADRVLPTRRLHDGGDRCPLGLSKQGEDGLLLAPATGRTRGNGSSQVCSRGSWRAQPRSFRGFCRATYPGDVCIRRMTDVAAGDLRYTFGNGYLGNAV
jgi:hypothetical protein